LLQQEEEKLATLESSLDGRQGSSRSRRPQRQYLIENHRHYWAPATPSQIVGVLQQEIMTFQAQHTRYIEDRHEVTVTLFKTIEQLLRASFPNYSVS